MSNIVERLRERSQNLWTYDKELKDNLLVREAADEIERLRLERQAMVERINALQDEVMYWQREAMKQQGRD